MQHPLGKSKENYFLKKGNGNKGQSKENGMFIEIKVDQKILITDTGGQQ